MNGPQRAILRRAILVQSGLLVAWLTSHLGTIAYIRPWFGGRLFSVAVGDGAVCAARFDNGPAIMTGGRLTRSVSPRWDWKPVITSDIWPSGTRISVPFWLIMTGMMALQARAFRRHRFLAEQCQGCGYPLGDAPSHPCPECGFPPTPRP